MQSTSKMLKDLIWPKLNLKLKLVIGTGNADGITTTDGTIITGGTTGIGLGIAKALAAEGVKLALVGMNQAKAESAAAGLSLAVCSRGPRRPSSRPRIRACRTVRRGGVTPILHALEDDRWRTSIRSQGSSHVS